MRFFRDYELGIRGGWRVKRVENGGKSCCFFAVFGEKRENFLFFY